MKVFVSWSGLTSRLVAEALAEWLPKVLQGIEPFVSAKDIDKGANWTVELARELEDAEFGVICLASDNLLSPWLNYETGAITKSVNSRVCPVLFGVEKEDVKPPMSQLQLTEITEDDFALLMESMNKASGSPLAHTAVKEAVAVWWPKLHAALAEIESPAPLVNTAAEKPAEPAKPEADVAEMLEEVLHLTRRLDSRLQAVETRYGADRTSTSSGDGSKSSSSKLLSLARITARSLVEIGADNGLVLDIGHVGSRVIDLFAKDPSKELPHPLIREAADRSSRYPLRIRILNPSGSFVFDDGIMVTEMLPVINADNPGAD